MTSSEGEQIWTQSIIGVIIQALVCKLCHPIDPSVLVALAVIDLFKPYFLIIGDFPFAASRATVLHGDVVNYSQRIPFKVQQVQTILFMQQIIHVEYTAHNLGQLALIF